MVIHGAVPSPPIFTTLKVSLLGRSSCIGQLVCNKKNCDFLSRSSKWNEIEWSGHSNSPPPDITLIFKVYKVPPTCVNFYDACIYYVLSKNNMTRVCIHLEMHNHLVFYGICQKIHNIISSLIAQEVFKIPTAKNFVISMAASKDFLDKYSICSDLGPKKMLHGQELEDILDKFEHLSSPNP